MKDLLLQAHVVIRTSNGKLSRHLAHHVTKLHQKVCRTCSMIIFPHSVNQIIDSLGCHCCSPHSFLNSVLSCGLIARAVAQCNQIGRIFKETQYHLLKNTSVTNVLKTQDKYSK